VCESAVGQVVRQLLVSPPDKQRPAGAIICERNLELSAGAATVRRQGLRTCLESGRPRERATSKQSAGSPRRRPKCPVRPSVSTRARVGGACLRHTSAVSRIGRDTEFLLLCPNGAPGPCNEPACNHDRVGALPMKDDNRINGTSAGNPRSCPPLFESSARSRDWNAMVAHWNIRVRDAEATSFLGAQHVSVSMLASRGTWTLRASRRRRAVCRRRLFTHGRRSEEASSSCTPMRPPDPQRKGGLENRGRRYETGVLPPRQIMNSAQTEKVRVAACRHRWPTSSKTPCVA